MDNPGPGPYPCTAPVTAMAPRKRELLEVLRNQRKEASAHAQPSPAPAPAPSRPRSSSGRSPWPLRIFFGLVWIAVVVWLIAYLWNDQDPAAPETPGNAGAPPTAGVPSGPQSPTGAATPPNQPQERAQQPPPAPGADARVYGILAITYEGAAQEAQATAIALEMRDSMGLPEVQVRKHQDRGKVWYEIYVGRANDKSALDALLKKVRGQSLPSQPGKKPFESAYVRAIPTTTS